MKLKAQGTKIRVSLIGYHMRYVFTIYDKRNTLIANALHIRRYAFRFLRILSFNPGSAVIPGHAGIHRKFAVEQKFKKQDRIRSMMPQRIIIAAGEFFNLR